jgi:hypothetical protein
VALLLRDGGTAEGASGGHQNQMPLVIFGLLVSIPTIVWGQPVR